MSHITKYEKGNTARFEFQIQDENDSYVEPDSDGAGGHKVDIEIKNADSGNVLVDTQMTEISNTQYRYDWQTTEGMESGEFQVECKASVSNNNVLERDKIFLDDIID